MPSPPDPANLADQSAFISALTTPRRAVKGVNDGHGKAASDRFAVYRNNVAHSLSQALGTTFAATKAALGDQSFMALALAHVREEPPRSPVLFTYGETFPARMPNPELRDLAALEYARVQAFHAADAEPASLEALSGVPPDNLPSLILQPHPATAVIPMQTEAIGRFQRHVGGEPVDNAVAALVTRPRYDVAVTPLSAPAATFAAALFEGHPLGEAAAIDGLDLGGALATLFTAGAILARG